MRTSEHFNLNLVEGSDIVNPLVTDVPNYESIDAQMFKNQNSGVQNATELKSGTVHAITRSVPDAQMITFTATSNFVAGDTFTVDGIQVSALTVSGEQLPTGAYVINSQVLAILKGTLLTVYGIGSEVADNSLALNGHPDTYFGTKEDVDNAIDTANAANNLVNELNNSLDAKLLGFTFSNNFFNIKSQKVVKNGNVFSIYLYGTYVRELKANKAYFIPIGTTGLNLQGVGMAKSTSGESDDSLAFTCNIYIEGNTMVFVPLVDIPANYNASCVCNCINITV